jgi:hypothetical protein
MFYVAHLELYPLAIGLCPHIIFRNALYEDGFDNGLLCFEIVIIVDKGFVGFLDKVSRQQHSLLLVIY